MAGDTQAGSAPALGDPSPAHEARPGAAVPQVDSAARLDTLPPADGALGRAGAPMPDELGAALREWAGFVQAARALRMSGAEEREQNSRDGRRLASQLALLTGRPVSYVDPTTGATERIQLARGGPVLQGRGRQFVASEPAPWATGLTIAAFFAVFVAVAGVAFGRAIERAVGLWWLPVMLLAGAGLAPGVWLLRQVRFWRWPVLGVAAGMGLAWLALLLGLLGPPT